MKFSNKRVLIVDDQRPFLLMLRGLLNSLGATSVVIAQNGDTAVAACRREKFDIIISDLHLGPDKKNGFQLLEEIRVRKLIKPETVFIMVSADSERPMVLGSVEKEPDDYIIKPFSQSLLSNRLSKAYAKKKALKNVYADIYQEDFIGAVEECRRLIRSGSRYRQFCSIILTDLYWRLEQYPQALHMLKPMLQTKPLPWVYLAMARTYLLNAQYHKAIRFALQALEKHQLLVQAEDIIAEAYYRLDDFEAASAAIQRALELSPYNIKRQFIAVHIARAMGDFEGATEACRAILEQTKKSVYRDVAHLCNYIRSIIDAAEHAEDKKERNKYQQEAMLMLQRFRNDELLSRTNKPFDYEIFEDVVSARINFLDGNLLDAKRLLASSQSNIESKFEEYPVNLAPDSLKVMSDLGEFEQAQPLVDLLERELESLDDNTKDLIARTQEKSLNVKSHYNKHVKDGIAAYGNGQYEAAFAAFKDAQGFAPMNTGVALNLLQVLVKLLQKSEKLDFDLVKDLKQNYRLVEGMPLPETHKQKLESMQQDLQTYLEY